MKNGMMGMGPTAGGQHSTSQPANRLAIQQPAVASFVPATPAAEVDFISRIRSGLLPTEAQRQVQAMTELLALTTSEMAVILATSERTFARNLGGKATEKATPITKVQFERLLLLGQLAAHGLAVFEDQGKFNRWLRRPLPMLQNQSPLQLLDTATGFRLVDQLLGRIEYGVYS